MVRQIWRTFFSLQNAFEDGSNNYAPFAVCTVPTSKSMKSVFVKEIHVVGHCHFFVKAVISCLAASDLVCIWYASGELPPPAYGVVNSCPSIPDRSLKPGPR